MWLWLFLQIKFAVVWKCNYGQTQVCEIQWCINKLIEAKLVEPREVNILVLNDTVHVDDVVPQVIDVNQR